MTAVKVLYFFTACGSVTSLVRSCTPQYGFKVTAYDNKTVSQSVMWTMNNLTKAECLAECYKEKYCISVHFSPLEPACVALRERFDGVSVVTEDAPGYQLFQTKKPLPVSGSECELGVDCITANGSFCHEGRCRCEIGYGIDGTACRSLAECTSLNNNFTKYEGMVIHFSDIREEPGQTWESCLQICIDTPTCKSADFYPALSTCYPQAETWYSVPDARRLSWTIYDYYQRECDW